MGKNGRSEVYRENGNRRIRELVTEGAEDLLAAVLTAWLFYRSPFGLLLIVPMAYLNRRRIQSDRKMKQAQSFHRQFRELLNVLASSISGGYSIERAFLNAETELRDLFQEPPVFMEDLKRLNNNIRLNMPVEKAFQEFAGRWPYEEVLGFAEIFSFAKRLGGDYGATIRKTAVSIGERLELQQEIEALSADKRMELRIMAVMPIVILVYISLGSPEFLDASYHNPAGILVMTLCLAAYFFAVFLGRRIIRTSSGGYV